MSDTKREWTLVYSKDYGGYVAVGAERDAGPIALVPAADLLAAQAEIERLKAQVFALELGRSEMFAATELVQNEQLDEALAALERVMAIMDYDFKDQLGAISVSDQDAIARTRLLLAKHAARGEGK